MNLLSHTGGFLLAAAAVTGCAGGNQVASPEVRVSTNSALGQRTIIRAGSKVRA